LKGVISFKDKHNALNKISFYFHWKVKFLKSCGALLETPIEIRKASEKTIVQTPGIDHVPPNFHSRLPDTSCRKLHWDEQPKQFSYTATEDHENSVLPESKPGR